MLTPPHRRGLCNRVSVHYPRRRDQSQQGRSGAAHVCGLLGALHPRAAEYVPMFYANELKTSGEAVMNFVTSHILREHLGEISETLFFLMGAMTVVEIIDTNGWVQLCARCAAFQDQAFAPVEKLPSSPFSFRPCSTTSPPRL